MFMIRKGKNAQRSSVLGEYMINALFVAIITADIAEMFHAKLREAKFSISGAILYFLIINLTFVCYMLIFREEPFSVGVYYYGPKSVLRYTSYALGLCTAAPLLFTAVTGPKGMLFALKRSIWLPVSIACLMVLSAGAFITYKNTEAVSLATDYPTYEEQEYPANP